MDRIEGMSISLDLDTVRVTSGLKGLKNSMRTLSSEVRANMSVFDRADRSIEKYETQVDGLNRRLELQTAITEEARSEYERMVQQHGEGSKQAEKAARAYNNEVAALNNLGRYVDNVRQELADLREEQRISESTWGRMGQLFDEVGTHLTDLGGKMKEVGASLSTSLTLPILGLGAGITAIASQFENSSVKISNSLGLNIKDSKELTNISRNLYKAGFGESVEDIDNALLETRHNISELNQEDLEDITKKALILAETFDGEVNEVTRAGNNLMKGFGLSSDKAFDLMAHGAQNGLNFSNEMFDNLSEYAPLFGKMGFSAQEYFQLLEKGSKAGVYNLDYINDVMKEFQIKLKDGSTSTSDAMVQLSDGTNKVWKDFLAGKGTVKDVHNVIIKELKNMDDQTKANNIGVGLYGTKWEDLEADAMYTLGGIDGKLKDVDGRVDKMSKNMEQSFGIRLKSAWRETTDAFRPFGEILLSVAENILPKVSTGIEKMANFFNGLSPAAQTASLIFAGLVAAIGPLITIAGIVIGAFGNIVAALRPVMTSILRAGGLIKWLRMGLMGLTGPVGLTIGALTLLGTGFILLYKNSETFRNGLLSGWNYIKNTAISIWGYIGPYITQIISSATTFIQEKLTQLKSFWSENGKQILGIVKFIFNQNILSNIKLVLGLIKGAFQIVFPIVVGVVKIAFATLQLIINNTMTVILGIIKVALSVLRGDWSGAWKAIKSTALGVMKNILGFFKGINLKDTGKAIIQGLIDGIGSMAGALAKKVNSLIDGLNWVMGKIGIDFDIPKWYPSSGETSKVNNLSGPAQYAKGTPFHPGGPAILGDGGGPELFRTLDGFIGLSPGKPTLMNLPKGTEVLPFKQSMQLLKTGLPAYKNGVEGSDGSVLSDVWSYISNPKKLMGKVFESFNVSFSDFGFSGALGKLGSGVLDFLKGKSTDVVKEKMKGMFDVGAPSGKGVERWKSVILQAAAAMKESVTAAEVNGILAQIQRESGGNEKIIQSSAVNDINMKNNNPARGLLQYIPQTFGSYAVNGHNNIYSGYDQLLAFFNNKTWRRDLPYGKSGWGPSGGRKFESGGLVNTAGLYELAEGGWPEFVIPTDPARRTDAMKLLALAGKEIQGNKRPNQLPNNVAGDSDNGVMQQLLDATLKQNQLLMQLLQKNTNVYLSGKNVTDTVNKQNGLNDVIMNYQF
ncbi:phage tail tape measure protein [Niallia sp. NCCP-28]|uniref:phage tail tape measure protein n=1 Tax=Niallia sp. NCCP-28 TaxID=2934712 RepID=UPI002085ABB1|nr:phage tail tape measure protein [Niallia sp. NCCP-28]GKU81197.1 hypothetical protein NCCP28_05930 [Niallia sp. NCCP-28]